MTVIHAIRAPDPEPTLAGFERALEIARLGGIISDTGLNTEVQRALDAVRDAAPNPPKPLLDAAIDAFLRQAADPRPWNVKIIIGDSAWADGRTRQRRRRAGPLPQKNPTEAA